MPESEENISPNFWQAYDKADKFDAAVQTAVARSNSRSYGCTPFHDLFSSDETCRAGASAKLVSAIEQVLEENGISPHFQAIEHKQPELLLLAA